MSPGFPGFPPPVFPRIFHCQVGQRGYLATRILLQEGLCSRQHLWRLQDLPDAPPGLSWVPGSYA